MTKLLVSVIGLGLLGASLWLLTQHARPKQTVTAPDKIEVPTEQVNRARQRAKQIEVETVHRADELNRKAD
jgi:plastocyanin domain-containing protein